MDDPWQRSSHARLGMDVGYHLGYSARLPVGLARLPHRHNRQGRAHGDFHPADPEDQDADTRVRIID